MRTLFCFVALILGTTAYSQAQDSFIITLDEFRRSLGDRSRSIYVETTSPDSLQGPIILYFASKFYLEDSSYIERDLVRRITEQTTHSKRGARYGALGGVLIGGVVAAVLVADLNSGSGKDLNRINNEGNIPTLALIGGAFGMGLIGGLTGALIGSFFKSGYDFPIESLEKE